MVLRMTRLVPTPCDPTLVTSSGPKRREKASCASSVTSWSRKTRTECCSNAARVPLYAASFAAISARLRPRSSAAKPGRSGMISMGPAPFGFGAGFHQIDRGAIRPAVCRSWMACTISRDEDRAMGDFAPAERRGAGRSADRLAHTERIVMRVLAIVMILLPACGMAHAVEIDALISTAIKAATDELLPPFERANGHTIRHKSALFGHRQRFFARKPILLPAVPMPGTALGSRRNVRGAGLARHWG